MQMINPRRKDILSRGFTIVEALVALVVLSVGMLGIAGLFISTLKASSTAISRMQAVNLASDLADRIRANRVAGVAYKTAAADTGTDKNCFGSAVGTVTCSDPSDMAANDIFVWKNQIAATLKGGLSTGTVDVTQGTPTLYQITVNWTDGGTPLSYTLSMQASPNP